MVESEDRERLARTFRRFAEAEAVPQGSPVYERLCEVVATDDVLLDIAAEASPGQPVPNLLFGAVHALLDTHREDPLAAYYPSCGGHRPPDDGLGSAFRAFVLAHRPEVEELLHTRLVQTNEVRRSAVLLPVFATVAEDAGGAPLALIEIGASAGLNLLFDRYAYRYHRGAETVRAGAEGSPLVLECESRDVELPVQRTPAVASRLGLELNALDVRSDADVRWLRSLVWPEHETRRHVLEAAIAVAREEPPEVRTSDVFEVLPDAIASAPTDARVLVFATFVLNQFSEPMRDRLKALLLDASRRREVSVVVVGFSGWFGAERRDIGSAPVVLATLRDGRGEWRQLAVADPHGWWIDWRPDDARPW